MKLKTSIMKKIVLLCFQVLFIVSLSQGQYWTAVNNPYGGQIFDIKSTPDGNLIAGTMKGPFLSVNDGQTWTSIVGDAEPFAAGEIEITPSGNYFWLNYELKKSMDGGATWEIIDYQGWTNIRTMTVNDQNEIFIGTNNYIWRSTDYGSSWTQLTNGLTTNSMKSLEVGPNQILFAGTYNKKIFRSLDNGDSWSEVYLAESNVTSFGFDGDGIIYAGTYLSGLLRSDDNGDTWNLISSGLPLSGVGAIAVNSLGAIAVSGLSEPGAFFSNDAGANWSDITSDIIDPNIFCLYYDGMDNLFAGTLAGGLFRQENSNWITQNQGLGGVNINELKSDGSGILYAATESGLFISTDGSQSWTQSIQGMDDVSLNTVGIAPNGDIYAGGDEIYRSENGTNWVNVSNGFPEGEVYAEDLAFLSDGSILMATEERGIAFSVNDGVSWTFLNNGLQDVTMNFIESNTNDILFTSDGISMYRSDNQGTSWEEITNGLTETDIVDFAIGEGGELFGVSYSGEVFISTNNGNNWELILEGYFKSIAINGPEIFAGSFSNEEGLYYSEDNGTTWASYNEGLPSLQIETLAFVQGYGLFASIRYQGIYQFDLNANSLPDNQKESIITLKNYPNPFNRFTTIEFELAHSGNIDIIITDMNGRVALEFHKGYLNQGIHNILIDCYGLDTGIYTCTLRQDQSMSSIRLLSID